MTLDDLNEVARVMRTFSGSAHLLMDVMIGKLGEVEDPRMREAVSHLRAWDFRTAEGDTRRKFEAAIFGKWGSAFNRSVFGRPFGKLAQTRLARPNENVTYRLLKGRGAGLSLMVDYMKYVRTPGEPATQPLLLRESLKQALAALEKEYGTRDMTKWTRPVKMVKRGRFGEMPETVARGTYAMQVSVEPGFPGAQSVLFPGNVENAESAHHADQFALYRDRDFKPMLYTDAGIKEHSESKITLRVVVP